MSSPPLLDLTGKVRKTQTYYFANGVLADIWKGEWSRGSMRQTVRYFSFLPRFNTNWHLQVAVKVIRDVRDNMDYFEMLKMVSLAATNILTMCSRLPRSCYGREKSGAGWTIPTSRPFMAFVLIWVRPLLPVLSAHITRTET
jgi:hypothetical protein